MSNLGLLLGEVLSPMFFFFNNEVKFLKNDTLSLNLPILDFLVLGYADNMVVFSKSIDEVQKS